MRITKVSEPRYVVELSLRQIGMIAYVLGSTKGADFDNSTHSEYATGELSIMYSEFNDAWAEAE